MCEGGIFVDPEKLFDNWECSNDLDLIAGLA